MRIYQQLFNLLFLTGIYIAGWSQSCNIRLQGTVADADSGTPLSLAEVYLQETKQGVITSKTGSYTITNICPGSYHLIVSHLGCETQKKLINIITDDTQDIKLAHRQNKLDHLVITAHSSEDLQETLSISRQKIQDNLSESLGQLTEKFTGVSAFKNGAAISKPIIHGLYGNRVSILSNGVALAGQQWGIDHAPEIDPQTVDNISVIKGIGVVKYPGANLGGVVLANVKPIEKEPHLHGRTNIFLESNGIGTGISAQLQQYKGKIGWKVTGTLRNSGDRRAPNYYLNNTGYKQQNISLQLESDLSKKWKSAINASFFNTKLGILRGALSATPNDLERVLNLTEPQFTESTHSFGIEAPRQEVKHSLIKWENKIALNATSKIETAIAFQLNRRQEFDVRRGNRSETPVLDLKQNAYQLEANWQKKFSPHFKSELGTQYIYANNTNFETNRRRLIPDYIRKNAAFYGVFKGNFGDFDTELGARISSEQQNVVTNRPNESVKRFSDTYSNSTLSFGVKYQPNATAYHFNIGYAQRNPTIDERFSDGVHVGVASYELGNTDLKNESALKITTGVDLHLSDRMSINALAYVQDFKNYIYLEPSGFFNNFFNQLPLFKYQQTEKAVFTGFDASLAYEISKRWALNIKGSYLWAEDISNETPVIFAPANNLGATLGYTLLNPIRFLGKEWTNVSFKANHKYTFEQKRFPTLENFPEYPLPPEAYYLLGAKIAAEIPFNNTQLRLVLKANNLLNTTYRDYLNRLRLFSDEEGINMNLTATLTF